MKFLLVTLALISIALAAKYDTLDVDKILSNDRVLTSYINCMLDEGPCTAEGRDLRENGPKALADGCASCSPTQKRLIRKACKFLIKNKPVEWQKLNDKYDPNGEYKEAFYKFLDETD